MTVNEALNWRYATKRMTGEKVPDQSLNTILEAIHLAPSSFGFQPYEILVISDQELKAKIQPVAFNQNQIVESSHLLVFAAWDRYTEERIDQEVNFMARERSLSDEDATTQKNIAKNFFKEKSDEFHFAHAVKQSSIALGMAILTAALEGIDASPMEGFNPVALNALLGLPEKGLRSATLLALGYRNPENDWNLKLPKARKPFNQLITQI
jgi:nitroreductase/dihydropteridine reductase